MLIALYSIERTALKVSSMKCSHSFLSWLQQKSDLPMGSLEALIRLIKVDLKLHSRWLWVTNQVRLHHIRCDSSTLRDQFTDH